MTSLDHLGVIAARLRRDAATCVDSEHEELVSILAQVHNYFSLPNTLSLSLSVLMGWLVCFR